MTALIEYLKESQYAGYHPLLIYPVLVWKSSKFRKGSSGKRIKSIFEGSTQDIPAIASDLLPAGNQRGDERKSSTFKALTAPVYEFQKNKAVELVPAVREKVIN